MVRRVTSMVVAVTLGCVLAVFAIAGPARAAEPNPYRYWSSERLTSGDVWGGVCDLRGSDLLWSETFWSETSPDHPGEIWLLDISSGSRSLVSHSAAEGQFAQVWGDYVAYTSVGPDGTGLDYELFLLPIRPAGESIRLSQGDGVTIWELEIDAGHVAWVETGEDRSDLYLYSIEAEELKHLARADPPDFLSLLFMREGKLAWSEGASLYLYDIASSTSVLVAQAAEYVSPACIAGHRLAWNQDGTLWLRDLTSQTTAKVADDVGGFDLSGEYLVWMAVEELKGGGVEADIHLKELSTGVVTRLTDDDQVDLDPQLGDHWVVWRHGYYEGGDLVAYDLASGSSSIIARDVYGFLLDGDRVAWDEYRGRGDVFLAQAHRFPDVSPNHPFYEPIEDLASRGIVNGFADGTFRPDSPVSRQQFAKMIVKSLGLTVNGNESCPFLDVGSGMDPADPFYPDKYVAVCAQDGITLGKTPSTFAPYAKITRAQLLTMVVRGAAPLAILDDPSPAYYRGTSEGTHHFRTWRDLDHAHCAQTAEFNGFLGGLLPEDSSGLVWNPYERTTRGEVARILWRLWQKIGS